MTSERRNLLLATTIAGAVFGGAIYGLIRMSATAPKFAATTPTDAEPFEHDHLCKPWPNGLPATVHWFQADVVVDWDDRVTLRVTNPPDAGFDSDLVYGVLQVGVAQTPDGGTDAAALKRWLAAHGVSLDDDRTRPVKRIAAPVDTSCMIGFYVAGSPGSPSQCACGLGCRARLGDAGTWAQATHRAHEVFGPPGQWSFRSPDGGMGTAHRCVAVPCIEWAGHPLAETKACQ